VQAPRRAEIQTAYREELGPKERSLLWAWLSFTLTFAIIRTITYSIKHGVGPFGNVSVGGAHLHHYMWGILLLAIVGAIGLVALGATFFAAIPIMRRLRVTMLNANCSGA